MVYLHIVIDIYIWMVERSVCWVRSHPSHHKKSIQQKSHTHTHTPWVVPPPSNSHHQDYYIFSRGSQPKPSFATGIPGGGTTQHTPHRNTLKNHMSRITNHNIPFRSSFQNGFRNRIWDSESHDGSMGLVYLPSSLP